MGRGNGKTYVQLLENAQCAERGEALLSMFLEICVRCPAVKADALCPCIFLMYQFNYMQRGHLKLLSQPRMKAVVVMEQRPEDALWMPWEQEKSFRHFTDFPRIPGRQRKAGQSWIITVGRKWCQRNWAWLLSVSLMVTLILLSGQSDLGNGLYQGCKPAMCIERLSLLELIGKV